MWHRSSHKGKTMFMSLAQLSEARIPSFGGEQADSSLITPYSYIQICIDCSFWNLSYQVLLYLTRCRKDCWELVFIVTPFFCFQLIFIYWDLTLQSPFSQWEALSALHGMMAGQRLRLMVAGLHSLSIQYWLQGLVQRFWQSTEVCRYGPLPLLLLSSILKFSVSVLES